MVNLYATLIINKRRTFDQVPEKFKADVEAKLLEYGSTVCRTHHRRSSNL